MTSETDELRRLLDERGVEWEGCDGVGYMFTYWTTQKGAFSYFARESEQRYGTDKLLLETTGSTEGALVVTAEQAVAATLGSEREKELEELVRDLLQLRCPLSTSSCKSCADCEHEDDEGCDFMTRALELGIEVY